MVFLSITSSHLLIIMLVCDVCSMQPGHKGVPADVSSTVPNDGTLMMTMMSVIMMMNDDDCRLKH